MQVEVTIILKVLQNKSVSFITKDKKLPSFILQNDCGVNLQIANYLNSNFNIVSTWLDIRSVNMEIIDGSLCIFYSSFVPKEFVNEDNIEVTNNISEFSSKVQQIIQQSLRLPAY